MCAILCVLSTSLLSRCKGVYLLSSVRVCERRKSKEETTKHRKEVCERERLNVKKRSVGNAKAVCLKNE